MKLSAIPTAESPIPYLGTSSIRHTVTHGGLLAAYSILDTAIADLLESWLQKPDFSILEAAELHGNLADALVPTAKAEQSSSLSRMHFAAPYTVD